MTGTLDVSRETLLRLAELQALVTKWTKAINLISKTTVTSTFTRHIVDSAQIFDLAPKKAACWVDMGSGAGFPGLVIACISAEKNRDMRVILIESDQRKATFLRHAAQALNLEVDVRDERIEASLPAMADVASARALGSLDQLCGFADRHLKLGGTALFHKGARYEDEVAAAQRHWNFDLTKVDSVTDPAAVILQLKGLVHA